MTGNEEFKNLAKTFAREEIELKRRGYNTWDKITKITDSDINEILREKPGSKRNLKCIRSIAILICDLGLNQEEASLLIHCGIPSATSLANLSPQEVLERVNRLENIIRKGDKPLTDLSETSKWIKKARERQHKNLPIYPILE